MGCYGKMSIVCGKKIGFILLFCGGLYFHSVAQQEINAFFNSRPSEDSLKVIPGMIYYLPSRGNGSFGKYPIRYSGVICL